MGSDGRGFRLGGAIKMRGFWLQNQDNVRMYMFTLNTLYEFTMSVYIYIYIPLSSAVHYCQLT